MLPIIIYYVIPKYGYGDCIVGLVSTYLISKYLKKPFYIVFDKDLKYIFKNIECHTFDNYINLLNPESENRVIEFLSSDIDIPQVVISNQHWHKILYKNNKKMTRETRMIYKNIYKHFLKPESDIIKDAKLFLSNIKSPLICIHIRCGDYTWFKCDNKYLLKNKFKSTSYKIIDWIEKHGISKSIYLSCDNMDYLKKATKIFNKNNISVYKLDIISSHFIYSDNNQMYDTILNHYIMSKCDQFLVCKNVSTYGFTASLISDSDNIWSFDKEYEKIKKINVNTLEL